MCECTFIIPIILFYGMRVGHMQRPKRQLYCNLPLQPYNIVATRVHVCVCVCVRAYVCELDIEVNRAVCRGMNCTVYDRFLYISFVESVVI